MYNFASKTQSVWFLAYFSALFLAIVSLLKLFNFLDISNLPLAQGLLYAGLLFAVGAGFGLGSLESSERNLFWKWKLFWLLLVLVGLVLTVSGIAGSFNDANQMFNVDATSLFAVGVPFLVFGTIFFFSGMSEATKESFGKLWIVFLLLLIVALIAGVGSFALFFLTDGGRNNTYPVAWDVLMYVAIVAGTLSIIPFGYIMGSKESEREKFHKFTIIWVILALAGLVLYVLTAVEVLLDMDVIGGASHREGGLILSLVFQAPGFVFLVASTDKKELIKKLSLVWVLLLVVGIGLAFASRFASSLPVSTLGIGVALVIMSSGLLYKAISVDYTPGVVSTSRRVASSSGAVVSTSKTGFEVPNDLPAEEKKYYIDMQRKTNENTIVSLNNAAKQNRLSKDFVARKVQELNVTNQQAENLIADILEQAKRSSRESIFEQAMGTGSSSSSAPSTPMSPPSTPSSPPPPMSSAPPKSPPPAAPPKSPAPPSGPPMPPPSGGAPPMPPSGGAPKPPMPPSGGAPPMPPGMGAPKPPSPPGGAPPMPPGMGSGGPPKPPGLPPMPPGASPPVPGGSAAPKPPGAPGAPGAPGGDAVGTARSTSIAELRGEMLKELRRLRDIFNEDQK